MSVSQSIQQRSKTEATETKHPVDDLTTYFYEYARQRPDVVAMWCFGIGFVLGWKLKPW
ncbi:MAG: hypothetical protein GXY83_31125 [Rhodopirellula sp.]|nr:hypothetical protein [Rhodopirellula sp.]